MIRGDGLGASVPESLHCACHRQLPGTADTTRGQGNTLSTWLFSEVGLTKPNNLAN